MTTTDVDPDKPKRVTVDDQTVESHGLKDKLDAADRRDATTAATSRRRGIAFSRLTPGDAV